MSKIDRTTIDQIKDTIDIVQYIGTFVKLYRRGKDNKGLCPFHVEKTPSFTVVGDNKNFYHCFGCGKSGDIIEFVKEYDAVNFSEAIEILAGYAGIDITKTDKEAEEYIALKLNREAMSIYQSNGTKEIKKFLKERKLSEELIDIFHLGYASKNIVSQKLKDSSKILLKIGLLYTKNNKLLDRFNERLMFPIIHNRYPVGFGGRKTKVWQEAKYVNSRSSMVYDKSKSLFGLGQAKKTMRSEGFVYLVEGYTDVLAMWTMGFKNTVAGCGTAFTYQQSRILAGTCHSVRIMFDADIAGRKAAYNTTIAALKQGIIPYIIELPKGKDPNQILIDDGAEVAKRFVENHSKIFYEYYGDMISTHPLHKKITLVKNLGEAIEEIIDEVTRHVLRQGVTNYFDMSYPERRKQKGRGLTVSIDQQMMACLLNEQIGFEIYEAINYEDFLEQKEVFKYILAGYELNGFPDVGGLLDKHKDSESYIIRATVLSTQITKNKAFALARKIRLRSINTSITILTDKIESKIKDKSNVTALQKEWDALRLEQLLLSRISNMPQW